MACRAIEHMRNTKFTPFSIQVRGRALYIRQTIFEQSTGVYVHVQLAKTQFNRYNLPFLLLAMKKLMIKLARQMVLQDGQEEFTIPPIAITPKPASKHCHQASPSEADNPVKDNARQEKNTSKSGGSKRAVTDASRMSNYELETLPQWVCICLRTELMFNFAEWT